MELESARARVLQRAGFQLGAITIPRTAPRKRTARARAARAARRARVQLSDALLQEACIVLVTLLPVLELSQPASRRAS